MYSPQLPRLESPNYTTPTSALNSRWNNAREYRRRIQRTPQVDPRSDPSIQDMEQNAEFWVRQLVLAMANLEDIKDTENSSTAKMFRPEAYDSLLLDATCREIFLALIDRYKCGFRGPAQFNKALQPNRRLEADANAPCTEP